NPSTSALNFVPSSIDAGSLSSSGAGGTAAALQMLHGHDGEEEMVIDTPADGVSMLPLSSNERLLIETLPLPLTVQLNDQAVVPAAGVHVAPPSVETSTPVTSPPPESAAVPLMVIGVPATIDEPLAGAVIVDPGGARSVDALAGTSPSCTCSVPGCAPMSANRLTVACCMRTSAGSEPRSCDASRPHAHCTVPAPKTSAPLLCRYSDRRWVTVPGPKVEP